MKTAILSLILVPSLAFGLAGISIGGKDIIRIEVEDDAPLRSSSASDLAHENARLQRRMARLERAVRQLQDRVFELQAPTARIAVSPAKEHSCYLQTMSGTFTAKGGSEAEAKAAVLKECSDKGGGIFCKKDEVECGSNG